jgi:hypothetical protein
MKLINGWYFDFKTMTAFRKGNSYDKRVLMAVGTPPSILKSRVDSSKRIYGNFFCEPEDHFNNVIDREYHEYLLSEGIEELLKSE